MSQGLGLGGDDTSNVEELDDENHWNLLARKHWSDSIGLKKVKPGVIKKEIWDRLDNENFEFRSLVTLENLQLLENYLWPGYTDDSTNYHVLLIALIATVKSRENLPVWDVFTNDPVRFSSLFRRILSMSIDSTLPIALRTHLLSYLINAFQSLDNGLVRKECAPLVSISIWHNLNSDLAREQRFEQHAQLRKAWRATTKRYEAADDISQARLRFERSWLYSMMLDFMNHLQGSTADELQYCERFTEFLTNLESQLPTRRYVNTLVQDLNLLPVIRISPLFDNEENGLLHDLFVLLRHYVKFTVDDNSGAQYSQVQAYEKHCDELARLQRTALKHYKAKLTILALSNYGAIDHRQELETHLMELTDAELVELCTLLGFRTRYPSTAKISTNRELLLEVMVSAYEKRKTFQESVEDLSVVPTEATLYDPTLLRNDSYNGSRPLAFPKLNLQYLSVGDFLWRSFILYRCESFFEIRKDMEDTIKRLQPRETGSGARFDGFSRMAIPITKPAILEVASAKVGHTTPAYVRAEIALDVSRLADSVRKEWEALRPDDVVYLLAVQPSDVSRTLTNGHSAKAGTYAQKLRFLRTAEVVQLQDENGRSLREMPNGQMNGGGRQPRLRRLIVNLDAVEYKLDLERKIKDKLDVYDTINVIVRRKGRENNFKKILETIQNLALSDVLVPAWLQEVFLGYGDPNGASYTRLENSLKAVDFRDTFLDWQHLTESFPGKACLLGISQICLELIVLQTIEPQGSQNGSLEPPYVLEISSSASSAVPRHSKKRRRDEAEVVSQTSETVKVSTYRPPNNGPYPYDAPRLNRIRFTPAQVNAIVSGTQPGLTVIVGPPGTGKTDVATQIISNIYHDFPKQRTLLIAHSNQALNQLFQKIVDLDIDGRHLLRLGHGEEDLETDANYGKYGRVESFLDNRAHYLAEVDRLAANFGAPGAHGNSCETAGYFNSVYINPAWSKFWDTADSTETSIADIVSSFPFHQFFQSAPQPLFPPGASRETILDIAKGCQRHINKIFAELEDIAPFEILRSAKDKTNYLMAKEARVIAMTSTHAAMRRQEISDLGFHYDNVVMEEAAQITEIENFIPLALQNPKNGEIPLQRVVLCGDHLQNSPIVQNLAFRQSANLEQSLFLRLVRLGVPTINLDAQGRARPSLAYLYKWRYQKLENLPNVLTSTEFLTANAGFIYEYQFINVPDYKDTGESQPSPHFFQNLGEAEYAVAIYQYMRLLGYPAPRISILTTYAGQRALIRDVLAHRCAKNRLFGLPRIVTTVDKYQGEQNDYVILSLTRTTRPGYLRDVRRLTVALSRARLGLYILGRRSVFEHCHELKQAFSILLQRPDTLLLTTGEVFPATRGVDDEVEATEMAGVEHLGQYVFEMTKAKVEALKRGDDVVAREVVEGVGDGEMEADGEEGREEDEEQPEEVEVDEID